jgi:hypothetical protein
MSRFFLYFFIFFWTVLKNVCARLRAHTKKGTENMPKNERPQVYTEFVRLRLTRQQYSKLQALCDHKKTSFSVECRRAIDQYLQNVYDVAFPIVTEQFTKWIVIISHSPLARYNQNKKKLSSARLRA